MWTYRFYDKMVNVGTTVTAFRGPQPGHLTKLRTPANIFWIQFCLLMVVLVPLCSYGKIVVQWNFTRGTHGWTANKSVEGPISSPDGLIVKSIAEDPWIEGPAMDLPGDGVTRVTIRMKSNADAGGQLFYGRAFREEQSARFTVQSDGQWHNYFLVLRDKLGPGTRFRLDPCAGQGEVTVAYIKVEAMREIAPPPLQKPTKKIVGELVSLGSGTLELQHYKTGWGNFVIKVDGVEMAAGYDGELIGLLCDDNPEWLNLGTAQSTFESRPEHREFVSNAVIEDSRGARWQMQRRIMPGDRDGTLIVEAELKVNKDRDVIHIPWLTMFPGLGTFRQHKYQGLFAGVEYLCDEPSSSEADIETPEHIRRAPDPAKITFPLMAIAHDGRYVGVIWQPSEMTAATFDSPDTIYNSGSHVMGLSAPAVGQIRSENEFCAHTPFKLLADKPIKATVLIIAGKGKSVVPAVKHYVALKGTPILPQFEGGFDTAVNLLSHGWLDSQINENFLFRHAVWGNSFGPAPAAEAAMFIDWLADNAKDEQLARRLSDARGKALQRIPPSQPFSSAISHAHLPTAPFIFGRLGEYADQRRNEALYLLGNFDDKGIKLYRPGRTDYSRTHFAKHANGLSGRDVVTILEDATFSADKQVIGQALELLDKQTALYADTVPRGAQTWEVPLHTPDVLASAHMVKAYTLGYIISGRREYLEQARYWAWTGVPFVYLYPPTSEPVGVYATIPVLGATNWKAPVWIGRPVQWCGLAYASALHLLAQYDSQGPWEKIAKGITATGLQMTWPLSDKERQGLLPDFFDLKAQVAAGPAINPGTVQAHLSELYGKGKLYDVKKLTDRGWFVHAPCAISDIRQGEDSLTFVLSGWAEKPYYVLVSGIEKKPAEVLIRKAPEESTEQTSFETAKTQFHGDGERMVISLQGRSQIRIKY
jgi:hypothetical protein